MPSEQTWWWIGAGAATALAVTGGVLIYRGRKKPFTGLSIIPGLTVPTPPTPSRTTPPSSLRAEICTQWKTGSQRPNWRPALFEVVTNSIEAAIVSRRPSWTTNDDRARAAFEVARAALRATCPDVPLPRARYEVEDMAAASFYWDELWGRYYTTAYNMLSEYGPS